ncbi:histone-lysine N-methyltransferase PR-Set7 [Sabethes cyaneus]|uniref:histone-lysine N-methyltransferase PR-Set7 n=1 Tax=Sabethes cyaneus TaxID=53552 RepID=UPI00221E2FB3|nr:histone-lysine N-methyltransferase PR-Set7 [Sabethes cyaneus]
MGKGRRTRQTNPVNQLLSATTGVDDTASPKRKDLKFDNSAPKASQSNPVNTASKNKLPPGTTETSMLLRASRSKTNGIAKYFTNCEKSLSAAVSDPVPVAKSENFIDLTDENTCDSFENNTNGVTTPSIDVSPLAALGFNVVKSNPACNIFLQEPVLTLNFDKTPTDQSRMVIKNSFLATEIQNKFSPPKCDPMWSSAMASVKRETVEEEHALDLSMPTQVTSIDSTTFLNQDSNSCDSGDSGVVILPEAEALETSTSCDGKKRKPATPHRILCPSPVKNPIVASPSKALAHLNIQSKRATRKNAKSKRRLHTKELENALEESVVPQTADIFPAVTAATIPAKEPIDKKKPVLNDSVNPTAQQNTNNNQSSKVSEAPIIPSARSGGKNVIAATGGNKKLTDFFQVRRSVRKTKKEVQWERDRDIEKAILEERDHGLKIAYFDGKGRGIVTTRPFMKGEFVVEYIGDLISVAEAKQREQIYAEDDNTGCYMYYFKHKNVQYCIDATAESGKLGRLVNHSRNGNLMTKTVSLNNRPHLVLIAKEDITEGVEVTYDYGDRSKEALLHYPWLAF